MESRTGALWVILLAIGSSGLIDPPAKGQPNPAKPSPSPASHTFGLGGAPWPGTRENVVEDQGDRKIKIGILADNFDDNNLDGWESTGPPWSASNGRLTWAGTGTARIYQVIDKYSDALILCSATESDVDTYLDGGNLRGDSSRGNPTKMYQFSIRPGGVGAHIYAYDGEWRDVDKTDESFLRSPNTENFYLFSSYGDRFRGYASNTSFEDAWKLGLRADGTSSIFASGDLVGVGLGRTAAGTVSFDNIRVLKLNSSGEPVTTGSITLRYDAGSTKATSQIGVDAETPAGTSYSVWYRRSGTGTFDQVGGKRIGNSTIPVAGFQNTEIRIDLEGTPASTPKLASVTFFVKSGVCDPDLIFCGSACVDLKSNRDHCGECSRPCAAAQICDDGVCKGVCEPDLTYCVSTCVDLKSSLVHCGECSHACALGQVCDGGVCKDGGCEPDLTYCDNVCVNLKWSSVHCGVCSNSCGLAEICDSGVCRPNCGPGTIPGDGGCVFSNATGCECGTGGGLPEFGFLLLVLLVFGLPRRTEIP